MAACCTHPIKNCPTARHTAHGVCLLLVLPPHFRQRHEPLDRLQHFIETGPFQGRVGIVVAAGEIGRGQAKLGQARAVSAAADDGAFRRSAKPLDGLFGISHGPRLGDKAFGHVAILASMTTSIFAAGNSRVVAAAA